MARPAVVSLVFAAVLSSAAVPAASPAGTAAPGVIALTPLTTVPADVPQEALDARLRGDVVVRVRVSRLGVVDSASVASGDPRLRRSALDAARWYLYAPRREPAWSTVTVTIDGTEEAEPLPLDVLGMAREAERAGDAPAALIAWAGVLNRCGRHPTIRNAWAIREHIVALQRSLPKQPPISGGSPRDAMAARLQQQRVVSRAEHADLVQRFETAQLNLAWWDELYQWDAASLLGCGRSQDAIRSLLLFRAATRDSVSRVRADRALAGIAAGDTVAVGERLKLEGRKLEVEE
jgi:TonB family protein